MQSYDAYVAEQAEDPAGVRVPWGGGTMDLGARWDVYKRCVRAVRGMLDARQLRIERNWARAVDAAVALCAFERPADPYHLGSGGR